MNKWNEKKENLALVHRMKHLLATSHIKPFLMKGVYLISIIIKRTQECCHITFASSKKITPPQTEDRFMSSYLENSELSYFHLIWFLQTLETLFALITDGYIFILQRLLLGDVFLCSFIVHKHMI